MGTNQPQRRLFFFMLCLTYVATGITTILPGPSLSVLAAHTGVPLDVAGWAFTASSLGFTAGAMLAGVLSSRINAKYILLIGQAIMALTAAISPLTHNFTMLLIVQFVVGSSFGFIDVSVNMLTSVAFRDKLGETLNNLHSTFGVGALIGPLLLAFSLQFFHEATWAFLSGTLVALLAFVLLLRQPAALTANKQETINQANRAPSPKALTQIVLWYMALQMFLYVGAEVGFGNWITTAISQSASVTIVLAAPSTTLFWLGLTIGRLGGAQIIRRGLVSESRLLFLCFYGSALTGVVVAIFPGLLWLSFSFTLIVGLFYGPIFPGIMAIASRRFMHALGTISSVMLFGAGASGLVIPVMIGVLITHLGVSWGMIVPSLLTLLIVIPFSLAERRPLQLRGELSQQGTP